MLKLISALIRSYFFILHWKMLNLLSFKDFFRISLLIIRKFLSINWLLLHLISSENHRQLIRLNSKKLGTKAGEDSYFCAEYVGWKYTHPFKIIYLNFTFLKYSFMRTYYFFRKSLSPIFNEFWGTPFTPLNKAGFLV